MCGMNKLNDDMAFNLPGGSESKGNISDRQNDSASRHERLPGIRIIDGAVRPGLSDSEHFSRALHGSPW
jgi:hypothetical protein